MQFQIVGWRIRRLVSVMAHGSASIHRGRQTVDIWRTCRPRRECGSILLRQSSLEDSLLVWPGTENSEAALSVSTLQSVYIEKGSANRPKEDRVIRSMELPRALAWVNNPRVLPEQGRGLESWPFQQASALQAALFFPH